MLVLANGAFKSGSTWLRDIADEFLDHEPIPSAYRSAKFAHWVDPNKLSEMLRSGLCADHVYLSKSHIYDRKTRDVLLSSEDARVLNIKRDLRDVLVSAYYHTSRLKKYRGKFKSYYWSFGRMKAYQILQYHKVWDLPSSQIYTTRFEDLKRGFDAEIVKIAEFLGVTLSIADIQRVKNETSIERLRERRGESKLPEEKRFFRRGEIGDWSGYFDQKMLDDLNCIKNRGLGPIDLAAYRLMFDFRLGAVRQVNALIDAKVRPHPKK